MTPAQRAKAALKYFDYMENFIVKGVHPYVKNDFMPNSAWLTIREALEQMAETPDVLSGIVEEYYRILTDRVYPAAQESNSQGSIK
jgi:predicted urease superfamily metal-dependent hydrolase